MSIEMERLNENLFLYGNNCFNKTTLEIFSLEDEYIQVLKQYVCSSSGEKKNEILNEMIDGGLFNVENSCNGGVFTPNFTAFRIVLGNLCNLRCKHCFVLNDGFEPNVMSSNQLHSIIEKTFQYGKDISIRYQFFGGEPLAMFSLLKEATLQIMNAYRNGIIQKPILTITTNGLLLNEEIASFLEKYSFQVGISIDGPKEFNDQIRGEGVFDQVLKAFSFLDNYDLEKWFLITPYTEIMDVLPEFVENLANIYKFSTMTLNTPFDGDNISWIVDGARFANLVLDIYKVALKTGFHLESGASPVLNALTKQLKRQYPCSIFGSSIMGSISPKGNISYCAQYWEDDLFVEKFLSDFSLKTSYKRPDICSSCVAENICGGPCMVSYQKMAKIDIEKCKFYKALMEELFTHPNEYLSKDECYH